MVLCEVTMFQPSLLSQDHHYFFYLHMAWAH